ncbi:MAG: type II secretion system protein, partial [Nitrospinota bacterium]
MKFPTANQRGFTLIELLVVIAIMGVLAVISLFYYAEYKQRAFDVHASSNLRALWLTCNLYWHDNPKSTCSISSVSNSTYGFSTATNVLLTGQGARSGFSGTASHSESDTTFTINSSGNLSES